MKAAFITGHGGNDVVQVGERPGPERAPGEVRVRLHAATLNRVDLYMRDSGAGITHRLPQILGLDGAGVIDEIDASDALLQPGQRVLLHPGIACGRCEFCLRGGDVLCARYQLIGEHRDGTFAQFVSVPARNVLPLPDDWSFAEGAAIGVNHLTAWRMLVTQAQMQPWETVLIFGIVGGVSLAGLQIAKMIGARAIVTSRDDGKLERALQMGADAAVNGRTEDVAKRVLALTGGRGVERIVEVDFGASLPVAARVIRPHGTIASYSSSRVREPAFPYYALAPKAVSIRIVQGLILPEATQDAATRAIAEACAAGDLVHPPVHAFPLAEAAAAHEWLEAGQGIGKAVVVI